MPHPVLQGKMWTTNGMRESVPRKEDYAMNLRASWIQQSREEDKGARSQIAESSSHVNWAG